jgi:hypothetical protein
VPGTAPRPILGTRDLSLLQWVLMRVIQLFCSFLFAINVEVEVAGLSEGIVSSKSPALSHRTREGRGSRSWFRTIPSDACELYET